MLLGAVPTLADEMPAPCERSAKGADYDTLRCQTALLERQLRNAETRAIISEAQLKMTQFDLAAARKLASDREGAVANKLQRCPGAK